MTGKLTFGYLYDFRNPSPWHRSWDELYAIQPGYLLENGAWRTAWPTAEQASLVDPERCSHLVHIDPRDPQLGGFTPLFARRPGAYSEREGMDSRRSGEKNPQLARERMTAAKP